MARASLASGMVERLHGARVKGFHGGTFLACLNVIMADSVDSAVVLGETDSRGWKAGGSVLSSGVVEGSDGG